MLIKNKSLFIKLLACALLPVFTLAIILGLQKAPSFDAVSGKSYDWKSDQWTLINYFAEWCKPCLEELPELNALAQAGELRVFGISYDSLSDQEILDLKARYGIQLPVLKTSSLESLPMGLPAVLPTTYLLSPDGDIVDVLHGKVTIEGIEALLAKHQHEKT
ncbi:TlpA disulfide reductase family protein [Marinomonas sp. 5E14-1]|uniref:TlpA family protein disulfide reductase n=1 Tax=Marinomonas sp. 5E14-1 TaxID=3153922 RepID=UPI0032671E1C